ncbi:unnamed protein product [Echinostoma caproni]|uniref:LisH domain-containing protein n=1 Tax=Echinostoma caproni TaxID=27848 RepID=A0A183B2K4_9TREM|nr:unnamed protein product [Echinostoma caproni]
MLVASGELETVKSHIRSKLILEMKKSWSAVGAGRDGKQHVDYYSKLASKLIVSHLIFRHCDYTLSVFVPESGLSQNEVYCLDHDGRTKLHKPDELLSEMKSLQNQKIKSMMSAEHSPLEVLLRYCEEQFTWPQMCTGIQTDRETHVESFDYKLQNIDKTYDHLRYLDLQSTKETFEQRLDSMRREMEAQYTEKLNLKLDHYRNSQLAEVESRMKDQYQLLLQNAQKKLEEEYEKRLTSLSEEQKEMKNKAELARQAEEREAFLRRQNMQKEVDILRTRLMELKDEKELLAR